MSSGVCRKPTTYLLSITVLVVALAVSACSSPPAPVVDRSSSPARATLEKDGNYRVRKGDTLTTIAFRFGMDHGDIARWNDIRHPYVIYPDQMLLMSAPERVAASSRTDTGAKKAPPPSTPAPVKRPATRTSSAAEIEPKTPKVSSTVSPEPALRTGDPEAWAWPAEGRILRGFVVNDPARNGLDIAVQEGTAVKATAAGDVVYSGNGLIGFGELIIIKHSERMLSAYAHNRARLVNEGERVQTGQKIAESGRNDRNEAILHFEIRVNGRPADPRKYLPKE